MRDFSPTGNMFIRMRTVQWQPNSLHPQVESGPRQKGLRSGHLTRRTDGRLESPSGPHWCIQVAGTDFGSPLRFRKDGTSSFDGRSWTKAHLDGSYVSPLTRLLTRSGGKQDQVQHLGMTVRFGPANAEDHPWPGKYPTRTGIQRAYGLRAPHSQPPGEAHSEALIASLCFAPCAGEQPAQSRLPAWATFCTPPVGPNQSDANGVSISSCYYLLPRSCQYLSTLAALLRSILFGMAVEDSSSLYRHLLPAFNERPA